jgi:hypothetical protein
MLTDVNWRMEPMIGKMLVAQLKLCNRGYANSVSDWWCCLVLIRNINGNTWSTLLQLNTEDWAHLNPTHTDHDKFRTQNNVTDGVLQLNTHTTMLTISPDASPHRDYAQGLAHTRHRWQHQRMADIWKNIHFLFLRVI